MMMIVMKMRTMMMTTITNTNDCLMYNERRKTRGDYGVSSSRGNTMNGYVKSDLDGLRSRK